MRNRPLRADAFSGARKSATLSFQVFQIIRARMRPAALVVEDRETEVFRREVQGELGTGQRLARAVHKAPVSRGKDDVHGGISLYDDLAVLDKKRMNARTGRTVDISPRHRVKDVFVGEALHADIGDAAVGAEVLTSVIVVVVPHRATKPLAVIEHILVDPRAILGARLELGAIIQDLERPQTLDRHIIFPRIQRPIRVIVLHDEPRLVRAANDLVDAFDRENAVVAVASKLVLETFVVPARIADGRGGMKGIVRIARKEIEVNALLVAPEIGVVVDRVFHRGQRHEVLVAEVRVVVQDLVIGESDDVVAVRHIARLDLLGGQRSVRKGSMTMQVRLAPLLLGVDKITFHSHSPLCRSM